MMPILKCDEASSVKGSIYALGENACPTNKTWDDDADGDDAIPDIVRRVLGMDNATSDSVPFIHFHDLDGSKGKNVRNGKEVPFPMKTDRDAGEDKCKEVGNIIHGLKAFLLPRYLLIRVGSSPTILPEPLRKAQEEEKIHRLHTRKRTKNNQLQRRRQLQRRDSKGSTRKRKRSGNGPCERGAVRHGAKQRQRTDTEKKRKLSDLSSIRCGDGDKVLPPRVNFGNITTNHNRKKQSSISATCSSYLTSKHPHVTPSKKANKPKKASKTRSNQEDRSRTLETNSAQCPSNLTIDEWRNYQIMARMIIAPFAPSLIATLKEATDARPGLGDVHLINSVDVNDRSVSWKDETMKKNSNGIDKNLVKDEENPSGNFLNDTLSSPSVPLSPAEAINPSDGSKANMEALEFTSFESNINSETSNPKPDRKEIVNNYRKRNSSHLDRCNNPFIKLSSPRESLESVVDGAICTLVRRSNRVRYLSSNLAIKTESRPTNSSVHRRRRQRRQQRRGRLDRANQSEKRCQKTSAHADKSGSLQSTQAGLTMGTDRPQKCPPSAPLMSSSSQRVTSCNDWILERNLLSTGYVLASGETLSVASSTSTRTTSHASCHTTTLSNNDPITLRGCPNMAPGVHCMQANTTTSFARSSDLMLLLHSIIGDDLMREIFLNTIVLIPAIPYGSSKGCQSSLFRRGNYFQLCGPPLNMLAKRFGQTSLAPFPRNHAKMSASILSKGGRTEQNGGSPTEQCDRLQIRKRRRNGDTHYLSSIENVPVKLNKQSQGDKSSVNDKTDEGANSHQITRKCPSRWNTKTSTKLTGFDKNKPNSEEKRYSNRPIPRFSLFYCDDYFKKVGLSPNHPLNKPNDVLDLNKETKNSTKSSFVHTNKVDIQLLNAMVQLWPTKFCNTGAGKERNASGINKRRNRWRRLRENGILMCQEMRRRHRQCDYARLLDHHCPLPERLNRHGNVTSEKNIDFKGELSSLVMLYTPPERVCSFLAGVLRRAFPNSFWGSKYNFNQVIKTLKVFVNLRRTEQLPEKATIQGIRVLDILWLQSPCAPTDKPLPSPKPELAKKCRQSRRLSRSNHLAISSLVRNVMRWLYCQFIIPLLRSTFYVTETEFSSFRVHYYRKPVWAKIKSLSIDMLLKRQYREMNVGKASRLFAKHNVGCPPAPLRLLPKKTGIRAIAMLSKSSPIEATNYPLNTRNQHTIIGREKLQNKVAVNSILRSTFNALKYEREENPTLFGAGVSGLTEVFPPYCLFLNALKDKMANAVSSACKKANSTNQVPLYFTSVDIKHCYDTINQKLLYHRMEYILSKDCYLTQNHFIIHSMESSNKLRCKWKKRSGPPENFTQFSSASRKLSKEYSRSIFVDGVNCSVENRRSVLGLLRDHIFGQLVVINGSFGPRYFLQKNGIPQGSILSSLFCNIYFGHLEEFMFHNVFGSDAQLIKGSFSTEGDALFVQSPKALHLLIRIVDDFLLISTDRDTSIRFLKNLKKGIPPIGVKINNEKTRVNYEISSLEHQKDEKMKEARDRLNYDKSPHFIWCGLVIDTRTCETRVDYGRFTGSQAVDSLVVHRLGREGWNLRKKMKDFVRPRCQQLLFSSHINSIDTVRLNFYQMFLLCAIKTKHYVNSFNGVDAINQGQFICTCVYDTITYAFLLISSRIKHGSIKMSTLKVSPNFELSLGEALWLGKHAFYSVLKHGGGRFSCLSELFSKSTDLPVTNLRDLIRASKHALTLFQLSAFDY